MVNVVIPCYNNKWELRDALRSLENQTKKMFLVTVVDDCSTENLKDIVDSFKSTLKISYIRNKVNSGPGISRNEGINNAIRLNCSQIMFMDSDDLLQPRAIEILSHQLSKSGADFVSSPILVEKKHGQASILDNGENLTWMHGKIYRTQFLLDNHIFFPDVLRCNEDAYFNLVCAYTAKKKEVINEICYIWRDNKNSLTRTSEYDFSEKHNSGYVISQCLAILDICNNKDSKIENLQHTLTNIYHAYQSELYFNHTTEEIDKYIEQVLNCERYMNSFNKKEILIVIQRLRQILYHNKNPYIVKQNILEWLSHFNNKVLYDKFAEVIKCQKS